MNVIINTNKHVPQTERNIILTGFMGVGKTTVGRLIASKLNREFVDVDHEIEKQHRKPITEIFKTMGESNFRQMERNYILDLCQNSRLKIVSLGGGAFLQKEIREVCLATSNVVYLDLSWEAWKERLPLIRDGRPILENKTIEEIEELYYSRKNIYALSHWTVSTDLLEPAKVADLIIERLHAN